jgi:hypothetical protein
VSKPRLGLGENVHIVYVDDSRQYRNSQAKAASEFQLIGGVIIEDSQFDLLEQELAYYLYELVQPEAGNKFERFHAADLLAGRPPFDKIGRARAIEILATGIGAITRMNIPVIYAAVDTVRIKTANYGSVEPKDMAFRGCLKLIEQWFQESKPDGLGLLVSDNYDSKPLRETFQNSFHMFRNRTMSSPLVRGMLQHLHDDMYFGDSKFSKGIQLADICMLIIGRHLLDYADTEDLYQELNKNIAKFSMEPL